MKSRPTITTTRLTLRAFSPDDAAKVMQLAGDRDIADRTLNIPHPYEEGMAEAWIATHQEALETGREMAFAVTRRTDGELLGAISLLGIRERHQAGLGYWIGKPYWNQGFCTEAAGALASYAFTELALVRVHACHLSRNPASGRVMQKIGMQHEGCRRQHVVKWDQAEDLELYGILRGEWEKMSGKSRCST